MVIFQGGIQKSIGLYDAKTDQKRRMEQAHVAQVAMPNVQLTTQAI